jgi:hypothetical protein
MQIGIGRRKNFPSLRCALRRTAAALFIGVSNQLARSICIRAGIAPAFPHFTTANGSR